MTKESVELKKSIKLFYNLLEKYSDEPDSAYEFLVFLRNLLKIQSETPLPTIEIMTLIKQYKPLVFYELRKMSNTNLMLEILTELSMDVGAAEKKLKDLID